MLRVSLWQSICFQAHDLAAESARLQRIGPARSCPESQGFGSNLILMVVLSVIAPCRE